MHSSIFQPLFSVLVLDLRCVPNQPLIVQLHGSRVSVRWKTRYRTEQWKVDFQCSICWIISTTTSDFAWLVFLIRVDGDARILVDGIAIGE